MFILDLYQEYPRYNCNIYLQYIVQKIWNCRYILLFNNVGYVILKLVEHRLVKGAYVVNVNHIHYYKYLGQYTVSKWRYSHRFCSYWKSSIYFGETFKKATIQLYIQSSQRMWGSIKILHNHNRYSLPSHKI